MANSCGDVCATLKYRFDGVNDRMCAQHFVLYDWLLVDRIRRRLALMHEMAIYPDFCSSRDAGDDVKVNFGDVCVKTGSEQELTSLALVP